jgi:hypothetical protein
MIEITREKIDAVNISSGNTSGRFVLMTEGEIQRQRQMNAEIITQITYVIEQYKLLAKSYKATLGESHPTIYKAIAKLQKKLNGLVETQTALKHCVATPGQVIEQFNKNGISLYTTASAEATQSQARAWMAVASKLDEVSTGWFRKAGTGLQNALDAIDELAKSKE